MSWRVRVHPEAEDDIVEAAAWYETHNPGLGESFIKEILNVLDSLAIIPFLSCRRHPGKNIRWCSNPFPL